jgi:hypothetical protein
LEFHFEDDEYIIHIGAAYGESLDRIEFVTNKKRYFTCGGQGDWYTPLTFDCAPGSHPRVIAFGIGLGSHDAHQIRAHYFDTTGDTPCRDVALELEM